MQGFLGERECFYSVIQHSLVYLSKGTNYSSTVSLLTSSDTKSKEEQ